jgi:hypothetical protein
MTGPITRHRGIESLKAAARWPGADRNTTVILATRLAAARADAEGYRYFSGLAGAQPGEALPLALAGFPGTAGRGCGRRAGQAGPGRGRRSWPRSPDSGCFRLRARCQARTMRSKPMILAALLLAAFLESAAIAVDQLIPEPHLVDIS